MEGVRRWLRALEGRELRGRVRAVPVLNVTAFAARSPFVVPEDGKNLNRSFPGDPAGSLAERLAYDAFTRLISGSDAYVDAHAVAMHVAGLDGVLARLGMAGGGQARAAAAEPTYFWRFIWARCRAAGWRTPSVKAGDAVRQGEVIGTVGSLDGTTVRETVTAAADGVVIFVTSSPAVAGD